MKPNLLFLILGVFIQLCLSAISGLFTDPILRELILICSMLLPALLILRCGSLSLCRLDRTVSFSPRGVLPALPLIPFFIGITYLFSVLTVLFCNGLSISVPESKLPDNMLAVLLECILLPAVAEEFFCRYALMKLLLPLSKTAAVFISAFVFMIMHGNAYQMPYAAVAGIFLALTVLYTKSILSTMLLHAVNNTCSVLLSLYNGTESIQSCFILVLLFSASVSVPFIIYGRQRKRSEAKDHAHG